MVVVTGGTGFVGTRVAAHLARAGRHVRLASRQAQVPLELPASVEGVRADVGDRASLERAFRGANSVVHLVGIIVEKGDATFERIHVEGTANALAAAREAGVRRFVHMSALGAREGAPSRYHRSKWDAETTVRESGLDWTIHQPSVVYGKGDGFVSRFVRMIRLSPVLPVPGDGTNRLQPVWIEDVAACFAQSLGNPRTVGRTFELGGPRAMTLNEILDRLLAVLGKRRPRVHIPLGVLRANAAIFEKLLPSPPLTLDQLEMLQEDNVCDVTAMRETFEVEMPELDDGLRRVLG